MSIVGPRPYIEDEFYNHSQQEIDFILSVKPGITGFWQVTERSNSTLNGRVETDIVYVKKHTTILDIKIIFQTIMVMIFKKGAY
jgi:lipopolysaccharide/colanic/teichoic acid biosynthesis glycosyltransferase